MPDRTVNQITDAAYRKNGVKNPSSTQDSNALFEFQDMLSIWSIEGLMVPYYVTENFTLTSGQAIFTIGVTSDSPDLVTATGRPVRIVAAFFRISNVDHEIDVYMNKLEYARIRSKDTETRPDRLYYDPQYPNGKIKFNVECEDAYDFHLISEKPLAAVTAITDTLSLPLGINQVLVYNLALLLGIDLKTKAGQKVAMIADRSKTALENRNAIEKLSGPVRLDRAITRNDKYDRTIDIKRGY